MIKSEAIANIIRDDSWIEAMADLKQMHIDMLLKFRCIRFTRKRDMLHENILFNRNTISPRVNSFR